MNKLNLFVEEGEAEKEGDEAWKRNENRKWNKKFLTTWFVRILVGLQQMEMPCLTLHLLLLTSPEKLLTISFKI